MFIMYVCVFHNKTFVFGLFSARFLKIPFMSDPRNIISELCKNQALIVLNKKVDDTYPCEY
jgi:hypothetical protein